MAQHRRAPHTARRKSSWADQVAVLLTRMASPHTVTAYRRPLVEFAELELTLTDGQGEIVWRRGSPHATCGRLARLPP
jgi:hypothetical protein